jgi:hypothetical protein
VLRNVSISKHVYWLLIAIDSFPVVRVVSSQDRCLRAGRISLAQTYGSTSLLRIYPRVKLYPRLSRKCYRGAPATSSSTTVDCCILPAISSLSIVGRVLGRLGGGQSILRGSCFGPVIVVDLLPLFCIRPETSGRLKSPRQFRLRAVSPLAAPKLRALPLIDVGADTRPRCPRIVAYPRVIGSLVDAFVGCYAATKTAVTVTSCWSVLVDSGARPYDSCNVARVLDASWLCIGLAEKPLLLYLYMNLFRASTLLLRPLDTGDRLELVQPVFQLMILSSAAPALTWKLVEACLGGVATGMHAMGKPTRVSKAISGRPNASVRI